MYYNADDLNLNSYRAPKQDSYIRIFNASPNLSAVDVYANDILIVKNLIYKQYTNYIPLLPGDYKFKIYPADNTTTPIIQTDVFIPDYSVFNLSIIGTYPEISLYPIPEPAVMQNFGRSCIRFINLSPTAPAVNVGLKDSILLFYNVAYKYITDYACIESGTYSFQINSAVNNSTLLTLPNVQLLLNNYYSIYLVGLADGSPALQALLLPEPR